MKAGNASAALACLAAFVAAAVAASCGRKTPGGAEGTRHAGDSAPAPAPNPCGATIDDGALPLVSIKTPRGEMVVELFEDDAPNTVANFVNLVEKGFYDGLTFHRVEPDFCIQGGDPSGDGSGGPGYTFPDEINRNKHSGKGVLSMANSGRDTNGSQFFITFKSEPDLDPRHTVFGRVKKGRDVIDKVRRGDRMECKVLRKRSHRYSPAILR